MSSPLKRITLRGFKSIRALEGFELGRLNVLIGANGAGKSNFVDFFRLLRSIAEQGLQRYVAVQGGSDGLLHLGPKRTRALWGSVSFGEIGYEFELTPTADARLIFSAERAKHAHGPEFESKSSHQYESAIADTIHEPDDPSDSILSELKRLQSAIASSQVYHFHDTSSLATVRREQPVRDFERLRHDGSNIAAFLHRLREHNGPGYALIRDSLRQIAPFFDDFWLRPEDRAGEARVALEWRQRGSDFPFQPCHFSDGTLRFICLATALLQPTLPSTIVIDEPELGLHPGAIALLADMIRSAAIKSQIIVSTQSPTLLDYFDPGEIVVVNRRDGESTFERLDASALASWLEDYSVGELWQKNVVRGGPAYE